jgi:pSer/pThr/pTyr-binding forkhead associated (FHA) protein
LNLHILRLVCSSPTVVQDDDEMTDDQTPPANLDEDSTNTVEETAPVEEMETASGDKAGTSPGSQATLTIKRGGVETDEKFSFQAPAIIGRFDPSVGPIDVDLGSAPEAAYVSRKHARIDQEDGIWKITDLGSSNGTFILRSDFERVEESELADGDEIALGNARLVFRVESAEQ